LRRGPPLLLSDDVEHGVFEGRAALVDHHRLAAALESGVEGEHAAAGHGGLEEQVPQVAGEHTHGVRLTKLGHLPAEFAFQARHHEPGEGIADAAAEKLGMRMVDRHEQILGRGLQLLGRAVDPHLEQLRPLAAVDGQHPVRRDPLHVLGVVEVVAKVLLVLGERLAGGLDPLAREPGLAMENLPQPAAQVRPLAELVGDDVADAEEDVGNGTDLDVGIYEVGRPDFHHGGGGRGGQDLLGEGLELPLLRDLRQRQLPRLEGQIDVFELLEAFGGRDPRLQGRRHLALPLDRALDRHLAVGELPGAADALGDQPHLLLVEAAGLIAAVARDEGDRVARIEQVHDRLDAGDRQVEPLRNAAQVDDRCGSHPARGRPHVTHAARRASLLTIPGRCNRTGARPEPEISQNLWLGPDGCQTREPGERRSAAAPTRRWSAAIL